MAELLNIDELITVEKKIQIKGKKYSVVERSVSQVLEAISIEKELSQKLPDAREDSLAKIEVLVKMVKMSVPDCPDDIIKNLPVKTLMTIMNFINESEKVEDSEQGKS